LNCHGRFACIDPVKYNGKYESAPDVVFFSLLNPFPLFLLFHVNDIHNIHAPACLSAARPSSLRWWGWRWGRSSPDLRVALAPTGKKAQRGRQQDRLITVFPDIGQHSLGIFTEK
jgi:hypothetical protein